MMRTCQKRWEYHLLRCRFCSKEQKRRSKKRHVTIDILFLRLELTDYVFFLEKSTNWDKFYQISIDELQNVCVKNY